jgi:hypothetical protein
MFATEPMPTECRDIHKLRKVKQGKMSYCMVAYRPHFFLLIEDESHSPNHYYAFSYVPQSVKEWIGDNLVNNTSGYYPWAFTKSHVVNSSHLQIESFIRLKTIEIQNWKYKRFREFHTYNVFSLIPYFGITDCIGYSNHHYDYAKRKKEKKCEKKRRKEEINHCIRV